MKKLGSILCLIAVVILSVSAFAAAPADTLTEVKKKGVLVAGVKNLLPPFGYVDDTTKAIIGYDVDFANALAKKLGVKVELKPVTSENRVALLQTGEIDIIAATMSRTPEGAKDVDFSHTYFLTGQKFVAKKGKVFALKDLEKKRIGTIKGTNSELNLRKKLPSAKVFLFTDYSQAFTALEKGELDAVTSHEPILAKMLAKSSVKNKLEIAPPQITVEAYALGMRKGDRSFIDFVNNALVDMEQSGEAKEIYDRWFGPKSDFFMRRIFTIKASDDSLPDTLAEIKKKGVLVAGVRNQLPPFGFIDDTTKTIIGYDIDFVNTIANKLGVKVELKPVTAESRIPQLTAGDIDIIAATMTRTPERAKEIDFSFTYFFSGQRFLASKGSIKFLKDIADKKIATVKGSTSELNLRKAASKATVVLFERYPEAVQALQEGKVDAVTTDEAILAGLLAKMPDRAKYEISRLQISVEPYGLGIRKGDKSFVDFANQTLIEMEKSGEAKKIFNTWFGPKTVFPINRSFKISDGM
jgi:polar amino acid transport system substrate-binding protein